MHTRRNLSVGRRIFHYMGDFDRPFVGAVAVRQGLVTERDLRRRFTRIVHGIYVQRDIELDAGIRAEAAALWAGDDGVLAGLSAAAVHGSSWIDAEAPAEVFRTGSRRPVPGVSIHGDALAPDEFGIYRGMLVTTPARTGYDLGRRRPLGRAVARLDALCRATGVKPGAIADLAERHRGARGIVQLRTVLELIDPGAESPQESITRVELIQAGLPRPATQIRIHDRTGAVFARADMGWERWKVVVEYDGAQHWTDRHQRSRDLERGVRLAELGWQVVRVDAELLRERPWVMVQRVEAALRAAGAPR